MIDYASNLLGVVGLAIADRIQENTQTILKHSGETPAALVVIGYGFGPSNDTLRRILGLSHSGTVRLVDRLVEDARGSPVSAAARWSDYQPCREPPNADKIARAHAVAVARNIGLCFPASRQSWTRVRSRMNCKTARSAAAQDCRRQPSSG